jgi:hypothetical protein
MEHDFFFSLLILLHLLLLTFWLGADLGTFYSSRYVAQQDLSAPQRLTALKIMAFVDMGPRICLVLFLPSGISLMAADPISDGVKILGVPADSWYAIAAAWVAGFIWLGLVLADHHYGSNPLGVLARKIDTVVRLIAVPALVGFGLYAILATDPFGVETNPKWLGAKVALYGLAIGCGVAIRWNLRPFPGGLQRLMKEGSSPEVEDAVGGSIKRSQPYVYAIWVLVITVALLGVWKPGADTDAIDEKRNASTVEAVVAP